MPGDSVSSPYYDENNKLRKTTPTILRIIDSKTGDYLRKCLFSNMFPIPYKDLIPFEINKLKKDEASVTGKN